MSDTDLEQELRVYVEVFKIPPQSCPPDYYTLLNLGKGCTDEVAIAGASKTRASLLNKSLPQELHLAARRILRRMERAKICLSDPSSRAAYLSKLAGSSSNLSLNDSTGASSLKVRDSSPRPLRPATAPVSSGISALPLTSTTVRSRGDSAEQAKQFKQGAILDLGPTTHINLTPSQNDSKLPLYTFGGVLGLAAIALIAFSLLSGTEAPSTPSTVATATPAENNEHSTDIGSEPPSSQSSANNSTNPESASASRLPNKPTAKIRNDPKHNEADPRQGKREKPEPISPQDNTKSKNESDTPNTQDQLVPQEISLASLEHELALPLFEESESAASTTTDDELEQVKLGSVSDFTHQHLEIAIAQPTIAKFPETVFYVRKSMNDEKLQQWEVRLKAVPKGTVDKTGKEESDAQGKAPAGSALDKLASEFDILVGRIGFEENYLKFHWEELENRRFAEQLRNCILLLTAGNETAKIQLRPTKDIGPFVTSLTERNSLFELEELAMPSSDALQLRIHDVKLPGTDIEIKPPEGTAAFGDSIEIKLLGWQGDASLRFSLVGKKESPTVRFTPRYRIGTKRNAPLTSKDVRSSIENLQKALADGRERLAFARSQVSKLPGEIRSVWSQDDGSNTAKVKAAATGLMRQLRSAEGTIRRMDRSIPDMEATIAGLEALASLARQFDQQGSIQFEVTVPCHDEELILLSTGPSSP